jgi:glycosyltransferase involved in cell wall biosynthesis
VEDVWLFEEGLTIPLPEKPQGLSKASTRSQLTISVVIPARNSARTLDVCLRALSASAPAPLEVIVVNDASSDRTAEIARSFGAKVIDLSEHRDANFCRNHGAQEATGDILLFLDSDVIVRPDTLQNLLNAFQTPSSDVVVGVYSAYHRHRGLASQYKNLWIRYSYLCSGGELDWIFGAVTAIRNEDFWKAGGFDKTFFMKHGGEDLEFGKRMSNARYRIRLNPDVEVEHLKRHSLASLLRNDFHRSQGFVSLAANLGQFARSLTRGFVNVYPNFAYSVPLAWLVVVGLIAGFWLPFLWWWSVVSAVLYLALNTPFLNFYRRHRGWRETIAVLGILILDHLTCGVGVVVGLFKWLRS